MFHYYIVLFDGKYKFLPSDCVMNFVPCEIKGVLSFYAKLSVYDLLALEDLFYKRLCSV